MGFLSGMRVGGSDAPWDVAWVKSRLDIKAKIEASRPGFDPSRPHGKRTYGTSTAGSTTSHSGQTTGGEGLSDIASRIFGLSLTPGTAEHKSYTTFTDPSGHLKARGSWDVIGITAANLGYGGGLKTAPVRHVWSGKALPEGAMNLFEDGLMFTAPTIAGRGETVEAARVKATTRPGVVSAPQKAERGFSRALMGGMGRGEWERPQIKKEEAKGGSGLGTVVALGGLATIAWMVLK